MNEREIFAATLHRPTEAERMAYLDEVCGNDPAMRKRMAILLQQQADLGSFMEHPPAEGVLRDFCLKSTNSVDGQRTKVAVDVISLDFLEASDQPGSLGRLGRYEIIEVVGRGGMGIVLKGHDTQLNRVAAVKVLAPELVSNAAARKRFRRESQAAAAVSHDHVVTIFAVEDAEPPYLVMEYVDGQSLQQKIDVQGTLEVKEILRIGRQVALGLAAAHEQGVIHRDVKPSNILLRNGIERAQITDFGLARAVDDVDITRTGQISGTPHYMSPEQAQGLTVDSRSDLFSLGSVLYAMCTGRSPFRAETTIASIRRVCDDAPRPIREVNPDIPDWLAEIIEHLLAKSPDERFQTAGEIADLLGKHLAHLQDPNSMTFPGSLPARPHRGRRLPRWFVAAAALLVVVLALGFTEATGVTSVANYVATVLRIRTPEGTLVLEIDDPNVEVAIEGNGEELTISGAGIEKLQLKPGRYQLHATKAGKPIPLEQELVTITRNGKQVVKVTLEHGQSETKLSRLSDSLRGDALLNALKDAGARVVLDGEYGVMLDLSDASTSDAELKFLANLPKLRDLVLNDRQATPAGLDHVKQLTSLRTLNLNNTQVDDAGLEALKALASLRSLWLMDTRITDAGLQHLTDTTSLRVLGLGECAVSDTSLNHLKEMKNLTELGIQDTKITDAGLQKLQDLTELRMLDLSGNQISELAVTHLNRLPKLDRLTIWADSDSQLAQLKGLTQLTSLKLSSDQVTDAGIKNLNELTNLKELELTGTRITPEGIEKLRQALPNCEVRLGSISGESSDPQVVRRFEGHTGPVKQIAVSPDGKLVLSGSGYPQGDWSVRLWEVATGKQLRTLNTSGTQVMTVGFSPDGKLAAASGFGGTIHIWEVETGREIKTIPTKLEVVDDLEFSPDGRQLLLAAHNRTFTVQQKISGGAKAQLWDAETGELIWEYESAGWLTTAAFLRNGERVIVAGKHTGDHIQFLDRKSGNEVRELHFGESTDHQVEELAVSADGRFIASASELGYVCLWDIDEGEKPMKYRGNMGNLRSVAFSPDGQRLFCGGGEGEFGNLRWLTVPGLEIIASTENPAGLVWHVACLPDGDHVLSAGGYAEDRSKGDYALRLWRLPEAGSPTAARRNAEQALRDFEAAGAKIELSDGQVIGLDLATTELVGADLAHLKNLPHLRDLNLGNSQVSDVGLQHVQALSCLESLNLWNSRLDDADLESLKNLSDLEGLGIGHTRVTNAGLAHLKGMTKLKWLAFSETEVTTDGLVQLNGLTSLEKLYISRTRITDAELEHLLCFRNLRFLELDGMQFTKDGVSHLVRLPRLKELSLYHIADAQLDLLKRLPGVKWLEIVGDQNTEDGIVHLQKLMQLEVLRLINTQITPEAVEKLRRALPQCDIAVGKEE